MNRYNEIYFVLKYNAFSFYSQYYFFKRLSFVGGVQTRESVEGKVLDATSHAVASLDRKVMWQKCSSFLYSQYLQKKGYAVAKNT